MMMIMMMMMMISIGSLLRSRCSWNTVRKISQQLQECYRQLCVLFHWQQSHKVSNPKGTRNKKKKGPPAFVFHTFCGLKFHLMPRYEALPPSQKRQKTYAREKKEKKKTKQNHGWIENASCIKELFVDLLKILVCSTTQKHSSNNKPNRSVNSTLLTSPYPVCMHTCQILTRCQKKNV